MDQTIAKAALEGVEWMYLDKENEKKGPFDVDRLLPLVREGEIDGFTKFWTDGMSEWLTVSELPHLRACFQEEGTRGCLISSRLRV